MWVFWRHRFTHMPWVSLTGLTGLSSERFKGTFARDTVQWSTRKEEHDHYSRVTGVWAEAVVKIFVKIYILCSCESVKDDGICWRAAPKLTQGTDESWTEGVSVALTERSWVYTKVWHGECRSIENSFGPEEAVKTTVKILRKMHQNHLADRLENKQEQGDKAPVQMTKRAQPGANVVNASVMTGNTFTGPVTFYR